ncbi:hypothetical protein PQG02_24650 [Nostoc sp. UHCC 0926]|uniref:hypothetical protein n=1 Tax=unclassified Nostoc TaxID=2593658 RepID=UPI002362928F|nr:hypothetical protein [Nostoc sp. UHCC 0926]WDD31844.1 hypothetical protein PQG02_24650 [Nostoc sp. UHCC 0926]
MPNLQKFYSRCLWRAAPTYFVLLGIVLAIALFIYTPQAPNVDNSVSAVETSPDIELAQKVAKEIIAACPLEKTNTNKSSCVSWRFQRRSQLLNCLILRKAIAIT